MTRQESLFPDDVGRVEGTVWTLAQARSFAERVDRGLVTERSSLAEEDEERFFLGWWNRFMRLHAEAKRREVPDDVLQAFEVLAAPDGPKYRSIYSAEVDLSDACARWVARLEAEAVKAWKT